LQPIHLPWLALSPNLFPFFFLFGMKSDSPLRSNDTPRILKTRVFWVVVFLILPTRFKRPFLSPRPYWSLSPLFLCFYELIRGMIDDTCSSTTRDIFTPTSLFMSFILFLARLPVPPRPEVHGFLAWQRGLECFFPLV